VDLAGFVGVPLGGGEVAEAEVDLGELRPRRGFKGLVAKSPLDPQAFLHRVTSSLEAPPGGGLVARSWSERLWSEGEASPS
jgi:hypothetical protein